MKLVITGGRNFGSREDPAGNLLSSAVSERRLLQQVLDSWFRFFCEPGSLELATGGARGADQLAWGWAVERKVPVTTFPADWAGLGKLAGPERNRRMLERFRPDFVLAFPGGTGTANCKRTARLLRIPVLEVRGSA